MQITLVQALIIGLFYGLVRSRLGYTLCGPISLTTMLPSLVVGIVLGDVPTAMITSATTSAIYLGVFGAGGSYPSEAIIAGIISSAFAISSGLDPEAAATIAVPVGLLGAQLNNFMYLVNSLWIRNCEKHAEDCNIEGLYRNMILYPIIARTVICGGVVTLALYLGSTVAAGIYEAIPASILHALSTIGGLLPAVGFAITISVIGKKEFIPFFLMGFVLVSYFGVGTLPLAFIGLFIAYFYMIITEKKGAN